MADALTTLRLRPVRVDDEMAVLAAHEVLLQFNVPIGRVDSDIETLSSGSASFGELEWDKARHRIRPNRLFRLDR